MRLRRPRVRMDIGHRTVRPRCVGVATLPWTVGGTRRTARLSFCSSRAAAAPLGRPRRPWTRRRTLPRSLSRATRTPTRDRPTHEARPRTRPLPSRRPPRPTRPHRTARQAMTAASSTRAWATSSSSGRRQLDGHLDRPRARLQQPRRRHDGDRLYPRLVGVALVCASVVACTSFNELAAAPDAGAHDATPSRDADARPDATDAHPADAVTAPDAAPADAVGAPPSGDFECTKPWSNPSATADPACAGVRTVSIVEATSVTTGGVSIARTSAGSLGIAYDRRASS
jgi:hypothetical protein